MGWVSRVMRALTKAESEVTRLEAAVLRWQREAEQKRAELGELKASVGARVFADETGTVSRELAQNALDLEFQIAGAEAATQVAEQQLHEARQELDMARAAEKRDQAAKLTAAADAHQAKVDELLRQLEELDGPRYVPYVPSIDDQKHLLAMQGRVEWTASKADLLRDPIGPLLAEAEALEAPVLAERRAREAAARPLVPSAQIDVPAWDDMNSDSVLTCRVSEGFGSATFEVITGGQHGGVQVVTLPDEQGRRIWGKRVRITPGGGGAEIRCDGEVLAKETRAGRLKSNGLLHWWVDLS